MTSDTGRPPIALEVMDPDDAADLLGELTEADRARLLALMVPEEAEPVRRRAGQRSRTDRRKPAPAPDYPFRPLLG